MADRMLPEEFSDLERFASSWCLATEGERYAKRLASSMDEIQAFYDAVVPRAGDAMAYCDKAPLDDMPAEALNLLYLLYSMITVSFAVECWGQQRVADTGAAALDLVSGPVP